MAKKVQQTVHGVQYSKQGNSVGSADMFTPCLNREKAQALANNSSKLPKGYHSPMVTTEARYDQRVKAQNK